MPRYRYTAVDSQGNRVSGELDAASAEQAATELESRGLRHESVTLAEQEAPRAGERLSEADVAELAQQISWITKSGLPLSSGLRAFAEELPQGTLWQVLREIADRLDAGVPLENALDTAGTRLPSHLRSLVIAGVRSGKLGEVLEQHLKYFGLGADLKLRIWLSLAYPIVLCGVLGGLFTFLSVFIVRGFKRIFMDFGIELPAITKLVLTMADWMVDLGWLVLIVIVVVFVAIWFFTGILSGAAGRRRLAYRMPLVGPLVRWSSLARFTHLLGLLTESELPLPAALQLAGDGVRDAEIADACRGVARDVKAGQSLADSLTLRSRFSADLWQILGWGEGHQTLPEAMHMAGEMFEGRARLQATLVATVVTPVAFVVVVCGVGFMVLALFMPLIKLITELSG